MTSSSFTTPVSIVCEEICFLWFISTNSLVYGLSRNRDDYDEHVNIVVLQAEDRPFGLVVDAITDTQEIVVKPLGPHIKGTRRFSPNGEARQDQSRDGSRSVTT